MKIAAMVILFYPQDNTLQNIQSYISTVEKLYIIDNTEKPNSELTKRFHAFQNAIYFHDSENKGIAERLNEVMDLAIKDGYHWLLTMDQDSSFEYKTLENYLNCIHFFKNKENVSMFGLKFSETTSPNSSSNSCVYQTVKSLITSGSMLNLKVCSEIGRFDENLFIDEVDFEYCLRSISKSYIVIQFTNIYIQHHLGNTSYHRSFKNHKITPRTLHSPIRMYYMVRNFLYVRSKYRGSFNKEITVKRKILCNRVKNNILYNPQRLKVIKYILKGFRDYQNNKMGKY